MPAMKFFIIIAVLLILGGASIRAVIWLLGYEQSTEKEERNPRRSSFLALGVRLRDCDRRLSEGVVTDRARVKRITPQPSIRRR
jgi:hypothetical protein